MKKIILKLTNTSKSKVIAIYGASNDARKVSEYINNSNEKYRVMCFIDDDKNLQNLYINGIKVYSIENFLRKFKDKYFDEIWFSKKNYNKKLFKKAKNIHNFNNLIDFLYSSINSKINVSSIADRKSIHISSKLLSFKKKEIILITGSGGSIGSEIVKQLSKQYFKKIILIDNSEFNLFNLRQSLRHKVKNLDKKYVFKLGSISDMPFLNQIFSNYKIDIIINCAAYKHVDFVEMNKIEAFYNNVVGNENLLSLSKKYSVKNFVLVSTDKAVNPTSFMGLTKRMCELSTIFKSKEANNGKYSIVRFGNVINSNGSLLPILKGQILNDKRVTITHPKMYRYFMSIEEASILVLISTKISKKSEIFVLEMGKPINILNLAKKLITSLGYQYEKNNDENFIKIDFIGIKKGEKLNEELTYSKGLNKTRNEKILISKEKIDYKVLKTFYNELNNVKYSNTKLTKLIKKYKYFLNYKQ
jgi:FlaA1/EpsC-like NDP-sugar epimerase